MIVPKQIKVKDETYEELTDLGKKNQTYDDVIRMLIKFYKDHGHVGGKDKATVKK
jgi:predicted CopG family antitoxin